MRYLNIDSWERKEHYRFFKEMDYPHFNICGNVDITELAGYVKERGDSIFLALLYASVAAANSIEEFRYRIRKDKVVVHDIVSPSFTMMTSKNVFSFCNVPFVDGYTEFCRHASEEMEKVKHNECMKDEPGRDDLLYITSIPWISFTGITHPIDIKSGECIPRISWGKYYEVGERVKLPLSVQVHHALMDGAHVGQYFMVFQELLDNARVKLC